MTELNDHLKLLFARAGQLFDRQTAHPVRHDSPDSIYKALQKKAAVAGNPRLVFTFPVELPANTTAEEVQQWLAASGFTRVQAEREVAMPTGPRKVLDVVADTETLGKTAGKDAQQNKPTFVSLMGLEPAQAYANQLLDQARTSLERSGLPQVQALHGLADLVGGRTH